MGLRLKELQQVVNKVVKSEKSAATLCEEVLRILGPTILMSRGLVRMAESANERLDVLDVTSNKTYSQIKPSLLIKFVNSESTEVRKLVARLLPENFLKFFVNDSDPAIRAIIAKRLPLVIVNEMIKKFPYDDTLRTIKRSKALVEIGLPDPKVVDEPFDMYGEKSMRDMISTVEHPGLTNAWYDSQAYKIVNMYGRDIEQYWEEATVHHYVDSAASMGLNIDREKLLDAVYNLLDEREEKTIGEGTLKALANRLRLADEIAMPTVSETIDPIKKLISSNYTTREYIEKFEESFSVQYATSINPAHKVLAEGPKKVLHPASVKLPRPPFENVVERALDAYTSAWNTREALREGAHYKLCWSSRQDIANIVSFYLEIKR